MSSPTQQKNEVKRLYESALAIIDERNLYTIKQEIKKHTDGSFGEYLRQNIKPQVYEAWWHDVQSSFSKVGLNFLRFKKKILQYRPQENHAVAPAGYLMLGVVELEAMISSTSYFDEYRLSSKTIQSWPSVKYKNGVIDNGVDLHDFLKSNKDAISMLDQLWNGREIISPSNTLLRTAQSKSWDDLSVKSIDSGKYTAHAINKAMRAKDINLRVKFPRNKGVFISVTQKSTE